MNLYRFFLAAAAAAGFASCTRHGWTGGDVQRIDSITVWTRRFSESASPAQKRLLLRKIDTVTTALRDGLHRRNYLSRLSRLYLEMADTTAFDRTNNNLILFAKKALDSTALARAYWGRAHYFLTMRYKNDSAYYYYHKAEQLYQKKGQDFLSASLLLNMAIIQTNVKDYAGSEVATIEMLRLLKPLNRPDLTPLLYTAYNNLGIVFNELENFESALAYHTEALKYLEKMSDKSNMSNTLNNMGMVYHRQKKYPQAIAHYQEAMRHNARYVKNKEWEAVFIDNLAYARFKMGERKNIVASFQRALHIRDSLQILPGIVINKLHLAEYYGSTADTARALYYAAEANVLARSSRNYRDLLASLQQLGQWDVAAKRARYLQEYVRLRDSLEKAERKIKDVFARIRFETDEAIRERDMVQKTFSWSAQVLLVVIVIMLIALVFAIQSSSNKQLYIERTQKEHTKEVHDLVMGQHEKRQQGRKEERERLAKELHDGVLGKLFGIRINLGVLNRESDPESAQKWERWIDAIKSAEVEIRNISHNINALAEELEVNFLSLVTELLEDQRKISNFVFNLYSARSIVWEEVENDIKLEFYRILQEVIQNINKYAEASQVVVNFNQKNGTLYMNVSDDGVGFEEVKGKSGIGLRNIRSRAARIHGNATINSIKNKGTYIQVLVPLTN